MTFEKGSLLLVDYTASLKEGGDIIETTYEDVASQLTSIDPEARFIPKLVSVGEMNYTVITGLSEALTEMSVGERRSIEVAPEKAWGARDRKKIQTYSQRKLGKDADRYSVGDEVEIDNKIGIIRYISSGRVQIDFNSPYAGKTIIYDVIVKSKLEEPEEIIRAILRARLELDEAQIELDSDSLSVILPEDLRIPDTANSKRRAIQDIFKFAPSIGSIRLVEEYVNKARARQESGTGTASAGGYSGLAAGGGGSGAEMDDDNLDEDLDIDDDDDDDDFDIDADDDDNDDLDMDEIDNDNDGDDDNEDLGIDEIDDDEIDDDEIDDYIDDDVKTTADNTGANPPATSSTPSSA